MNYYMGSLKHLSLKNCCFRPNKLLNSHSSHFNSELFMSQFQSTEHGATGPCGRTAPPPALEGRGRGSGPATTRSRSTAATPARARSSTASTSARPRPSPATTTWSARVNAYRIMDCATHTVQKGNLYPQKNVNQRSPDSETRPPRVKTKFQDISPTHT